MGLRLAIYCILKCKYNFLTLVMGICCSTFVQINAGTSGRDFLTPEGITRHPSVWNSNLLVCRWGHWCGREAVGSQLENDYGGKTFNMFEGLCCWLSSQSVLVVLYSLKTQTTV